MSESTARRPRSVPRPSARNVFVAGLIALVVGGLAMAAVGPIGYAASAASGVVELGLALLLVSAGLLALERRARRGRANGRPISALAAFGLAAPFALTAVIGFAGGLTGPGTPGAAASPGAPVESRLADYLDPRWTSAAPDSEIGDLAGKVVGGLVVVDVGKREVMLAGWLDAHPDGQAGSADDVRTVALVWSKDIEVGTYTDGASAWRKDDWVRVVDFASKEVLGDARVAGGRPPASKSGAGDATGSPPDLVGFLNGLRPSAPPPTSTP